MFELMFFGSIISSGTQPTVPTPSKKYTNGIFDFSSISDANDVPPKQWKVALTKLWKHAKGLGLQPERCEPLAKRTIAQVKSGKLPWDREAFPDLMEFLMQTVGEQARSYRWVPGVTEPKATESVAAVPKRRRLRQRGKVPPMTIGTPASVPEVLAHLPTIALLVSKLNELLNPIANPDSDRSAGEVA